MKPVVIIIQQKAISWNKLYSSPHWSIRAKIAKEWHELVYWTCQQQMIRKNIGKGVDIEVIAYCKGKLLDPDNICSAKLIIDGLKKADIIGDDTPEWVKSVTTRCLKAKTDYIKVVITR